MGLLSILQSILDHPLNQQRKPSALFRFGRWQLGSRLLGLPAVTDFVNDSRLMISKGVTSGTGNFYCGLFDFEEMSFLLHFLREDDLFVDVGANIGSYVVLAGAGVGCHSHAIEPIPETFERLLDNINLNRISDRVQAHNVGVASADGMLQFSSGLDAMNHVISDETNSRQRSVEVPVRTLDNIIGDEKPVALKIDVEGFESAVVEGAKKVFASESLRVVIMEANGRGERYGFDEALLHNKMTDYYGFQSVCYNPFDRHIELATDPDRVANNILYVRDLDKVADRLLSALPFSIFGENI